MEALGFLLHLLDCGWHPYGRRALVQRNQLFSALGDALQALHGAAGYVDDVAVQRITAVVESMGVLP
jgi:uncharacterized membrane protein YhhN